MATAEPSAQRLRRTEEAAPSDRAGTVIREYRLASKQEQVDLAAAMGMTQQFLSQIENGTRNATLEQRRKFAQVLGIPPEDLGLASRGRPRVAPDDAVLTSRPAAAGGGHRGTGSTSIAPNSPGSPPTGTRPSSGQPWATFFCNPNAGYWSDPSRIADAAVPGVVRLEWTGPEGNRLYVQRPNHGRAIGG